MTDQQRELALKVLQNMRAKRHVHKIIPDTELWYAEYAGRLFAAWQEGQEPVAFGAQLPDGKWIGIWNDKELAELVAEKHPKGIVVPLFSARQEQVAPDDATRYSLAVAALQACPKIGNLETANAVIDTVLKAMSPLYAIPPASDALDAKRCAGIYVASRVIRAPIWRAYRQKGVQINSSWIDEAGEGETADFGELWARIQSEISNSVALIFYAAGVEDFPFKGALVEVGMALAMNKPVFACIDNVMLEGRTLRPVGSWALDRRVTMCETLDAAIAAAMQEKRHD